MADEIFDNASWSKEKLLQTDGDLKFLEEKLNKWKTLAYHWTMKRPRKIWLTAAIDKKIDQGDTLREWLDVIYTPLEATILAASITSWEWITHILSVSDDYHTDEVYMAISFVDVEMVMPDGVDGSFADIIEPDKRLFPHDVTLLDIINIIDREVAKHLYKEKSLPNCQ